MANTYSWKINYMDTKPSQNGLEKVVVSCQWSVTATDGETPPTTASNFGYATFSSPDSEAFTAYDSLTEADVLAWVWASGVDKSSVESGLDAQINQAKNPPTVVLSNPWNSVQTTTTE